MASTDFIYNNNDDVSRNDESTSYHVQEGGIEEEPKMVLAKGQTKAVRCLRIIVILVLLGATAIACFAVYRYTSTKQQEEFEDDFHDFAQQIIDTVHVNAQNKLEAVGALALQLQAYAVDHNLTWPFVTMPFFENHVMATKSLTDAYGVLVFPIVTNDTRGEWEQYAVEHSYWVGESYEAQQQVYGYDNSELEDKLAVVDWFDHLWGPDFYNESNPDYTAGIAKEIFVTVHDDDDQDDPVIDTSEGPYFPQWQTAPMSWYYQGSVNLNYGSYPDFLDQTAIVGANGSAAFGTAWQDYQTPGYLSTLLYPIFDKFYEEDKKVVAYISIDIFWEGTYRSPGERCLCGDSNALTFGHLMSPGKSIPRENFTAEYGWHLRCH
jgi:hypothetical protein